LKPVKLPVESWGVCRARRCEAIGDLADGLCILHWDRTFDQVER